MKIPKRFKDYLEATRDNDRAIDESDEFQHELDYRTFVAHCPKEIINHIRKHNRTLSVTK